MSTELLQYVVTFLFGVVVGMEVLRWSRNDR